MLSLYVCFLWISEETATFSLYKSSLLAFVTEVEIVYCEVRTESLYKTDSIFRIRVNIAVLFLIISRVWAR